VAVIAFASLASTASVQNSNPDLVDGSLSTDDYQPSGPAPESVDSYQLYQPQVVLPLNIQLPREEQSPIPFYSPEPIAYLKAPQENQEPNYYNVQLPAQELVAPVETVWNPNNDPTLYYEFNKDIHSKDKPFSAKPKQEIVLEPIDEKQYESKQKDLHKVFEKLAKKENQKQVQLEKVKNETKSDDIEQQPAGTEVENEIDSEGVDETDTPSEDYNQGLDKKITDSLGITSSNAPTSGGDRIDFHMVGHDGPHSYKWGFDTGKGNNRQFRYEEKDKTGLVKGHYGFYGKNGKLQIVHYDSHPHGGFHAEGNFGKF
ncbi:hypothetical protein NQ314_016476, partial [Rhamnusium bicolor]